MITTLRSMYTAKLLSFQNSLVCHRRSYDRDAQIEQADHVKALARQS